MGSCSFCYVLLLYAIMGKLFCVSGKHRDEQQGCGIFVNAVFFDIYFIHIKLFGLSWRNQRNSYIYIYRFCVLLVFGHISSVMVVMSFLCVYVCESVGLLLCISYSDTYVCLHTECAADYIDRRRHDQCLRQPSLHAT